MTLHYQIIFGYLLFQGAFIILLSIPFPSRVRKALLKACTLSKPAQWFFKAQTFLLFFIAIFFFESLRNLNNATEEHHELRSEDNTEIHSHKDENMEDLKLHCKMFYSQRNLYITGITLFMSFMLNRWLAQLKQYEYLEYKLEKFEKEEKEQKDKKKVN